MECPGRDPSPGPWLWLLKGADLLNGHWTRKDSPGQRPGEGQGEMRAHLCYLLREDPRD